MKKIKAWIIKLKNKANTTDFISVQTLNSDYFIFNEKEKAIRYMEMNGLDEFEEIVPCEIIV